jgi:hypothetical protein
MEPEAKTLGMQVLSDLNFRTGVCAPYAGHHAGSNFLADDINHARPLIGRSSAYTAGNMKKSVGTGASDHRYVIFDIYCARMAYIPACRRSLMRDRREKFKELAEARVNKTLKNLQLIGNLSNRSAYDYSEADVRKMFASLQRGLEAAKGRFTRSGGTSDGEFRL